MAILYIAFLYLGKSYESVQCTMLKACDTCADMGQLKRTVPIRKTPLFALHSALLQSQYKLPNTSTKIVKVKDIVIKNHFLSTVYTWGQLSSALIVLITCNSDNVKCELKLYTSRYNSTLLMLCCVVERFLRIPTHLLCRLIPCVLGILKINLI